VVESSRADAALAWNDQALNAARATADPKAEVSLLDDRASIQLGAGRYGAAEATLNQALKQAGQIGDSYSQALILSTLGSMNLFRGRYGTSAANLEQSVALLKKVGEPYVAAPVYINLAEVYQLLGADESAEAALANAQDCARRAGFPIAAELGRLIGAMRNNMPGTERAAVAVGMQKWLDQPEVKELAHSFGPMLRAMLKVYDDPKHATTQPLPEGSKSASTLPGFAAFLRGRTLQQRGDFAGARAEWSKGLASSPGGDLRAGLLGSIAAAWWREGNEEAGTRFMMQAADALERTVDDVHVEELVGSFLGDFRNAYFDILIRMLIREGKTSKAFDYSERARARAFLQLIGNTRLDARHGAAEPLLHEAESLRAQISTWEQQSAGSTSVTLANDLQQARDRYNGLLTRLKVSNPEYAAITRVEPLRLEDIRRELAPGTTLISYFVTTTQVQAWVVDSSHVHYVALPVTAADMDHIACWAERMGNRNGSDARGVQRHNLNCAENGDTEAFRLLFEPLREKISGRRLIIVPHSVLHFVPFAALRDGSIGFLHAKETPAGGRALVLGDPETTSGKLAGARREAERIASALDTTALLDTHATESALHHLDGEVGVIHIAAHGRYDRRNPLFSHLALAPDAENDGRLEVHEILGDLDLTGVNLVVLSACESGLGKGSRGDDVVGLTRAFLYAGAPGVMSTLWDIDDAATAELMESFYARFRAGDSAADSLRNAQLAMLRRHDAHAAPEFWAAFTLTGDPQSRWKTVAANR